MESQQETKFYWGCIWLSEVQFNNIALVSHQHNSDLYNCLFKELTIHLFAHHLISEMIYAHTHNHDKQLSSFLTNLPNRSTYSRQLREGEIVSIHIIAEKDKTFSSLQDIKNRHVKNSSWIQVNLSSQSHLFDHIIARTHSSTIKQPLPKLCQKD